MHLRIFIPLLMGLLVSGCIGSSVIVEGRVGKPLAPDSVRLFYATRPDCDFEVIAVIEIPGNYFTPASLIDAFRRRAAQIGANAVQVHYLQKTGTSEYLGQARALRCRAVEVSSAAEAMI